jgi:hypothetical protein
VEVLGPRQILCNLDSLINHFSLQMAAVSVGGIVILLRELLFDLLISNKDIMER